MSTKVEFKDYSVQVKAAINEAAISYLHEAGGEIVSQTVRNSRRRTGETAGSFRYVVDVANHEATIGSPMENAIWEEFGTGEYALNGDGRKGGWTYKDNRGQWHHTKGKTPTRAFWSAFQSIKSALIKRAEEIFSQKMK